MSLPRLDHVISGDDVRQKGGGKFAASYVPWGKISQLLREHAPGWQPYAEPAADGSMAHAAPNGTFYMLLGFRHPDPEMPDTELVPHAVMDHQMRAKTNPDARDIADSYVRGMCKAAALLFGLGIEMWTGDPLDDDDDAPPARKVQAKKARSRDLDDVVMPLKIEGWDSREHAAEALKLCGDMDQLAAWTHKTKASGFQGIDRDELREAFQERKAMIEEGEA
jgi:hypothetical protein